MCRPGHARRRRGGHWAPLSNAPLPFSAGRFLGVGSRPSVPAEGPGLQSWPLAVPPSRPLSRLPFSLLFLSFAPSSVLSSCLSVQLPSCVKVSVIYPCLFHLYLLHARHRVRLSVSIVYFLSFPVFFLSFFPSGEPGAVSGPVKGRACEKPLPTGVRRPRWKRPAVNKQVKKPGRCGDLGRPEWWPGVRGAGGQGRPRCRGG